MPRPVGAVHQSFYSSPYDWGKRMKRNNVSKEEAKEKINNHHSSVTDLDKEEFWQGYNEE